MKLDDKWYQRLKWLALVALPAVSLFYQTIAPSCGLPAVEAVTKVLTALAVLIGSLIGVSTAEYYRTKDAEETDTAD